MRLSCFSAKIANCQRLSWRAMRISLTSSMMAAAVGMAIRAPRTPSRLPPAMTEMTATAPGTAGFLHDAR